MAPMTNESRESERTRLEKIVVDFGKAAPERHRGDLPQDIQAAKNAEYLAAQDRLAEMAKEDDASRSQ